MRVLYLSYWNVSDPLTVATVYPNLKILQEFDFIKQIVFVNTERTFERENFKPGFPLNKIEYQPLFSKRIFFSFLDKIFDFILFPIALKKIIDTNCIDLVIARGAPAGALAYLAFKKTRTPFLVESFEPHSDYMCETSVWKRTGLRYLFQKHWEARQKKYAAGLMPVSENYRRKLIREGVNPIKIKTTPCAVNTHVFSFRESERERIRKKFNIRSDTTVALYAGKYGGLYLEEESFKLYKVFFNELNDLFLFILSPVEFHDWIKKQISKWHLPDDKIFVSSVRHAEIPSFCSASDFGLATIKSYKSSAYCSPVKIGEYWSCGLPVVLTRGVGDESEIIEEKAAGVFFDPGCINAIELRPKIRLLMEQVEDKATRGIVRNLALTLRSFAGLKSSYQYFLKRDE